MEVYEQLVKASQLGEVETIKCILEEVGINRVDEYILYEAVILWAIRENRENVLQYLYNVGVNLSYREDEALKIAAMHGSLDCIKFLADKGANLKFDNNQTLRWAIFYGQLAVVKFLVAKGLSLDGTFNPELQIASANSHQDLVNFFKLWTRTDQMAVFIRERIIHEHTSN